MASHSLSPEFVAVYFPVISSKLTEPDYKLKELIHTILPCVQPQRILTIVAIH
jgi:hypothetical protein